MKIFIQINDGEPIEWQEIDASPVKITPPSEEELKEVLQAGGGYFIAYLSDKNGNTLKIYPAL